MINSTIIAVLIYVFIFTYICIKFFKETKQTDEDDDDLLPTRTADEFTKVYNYMFEMKQEMWKLEKRIETIEDKIKKDGD